MISPEAAFAAARAQMSGPLIWGACDCATAAAAAWAVLHGRDPLAAFRQRYSSPTGAMRILVCAGGYLAWCDTVFAAAGLVRVARPVPGDLVLIESDGPIGAALGLAIEGARVATKTETGLCVARAPVLGVWKCRFLDH
ncbi:hypothetical protein O4H53_23855 [Sulfitobacter sp. G21635-S1]|uniref:DUF6950 family protein n=1 Tax=Sulfitobacter sp. G21635-S1 TaxID=3014043 RepID=UPI0022AEC32A|nr:hypothetical protein [Sulfitobacter sp. G21635-S1]MCZ4258589.1 hypothetical protein [Sulfitobacter sp. G21635-S1]